ncbi:MAG: hypothetical protein OZ921_07195 [Sorangiineae bacterium]|nr:hypothetical protein [Polyangiaceae bacterium]MEB2322281.1 hypothetical protein [Sorangiineae bacterium]
MRRSRRRAVFLLWAGVGAVLSAACGDNGVLPTTVDPGQDFEFPDVVYDADYFYCKVEPALFGLKCGGGDPAAGDATGGCHSSVTSYRLIEYSPLVGDSCANDHPTISPPAAAEKNYQSSQAKMSRTAESAPLLVQPSGRAAHPRVVVNPKSGNAQTAQLSKDFIAAVTEWANTSR